MSKKIEKIGSIAESLGFRNNHKTLSKRTRVFLARSGLLGRRPELFRDGTIEDTAQEFVIANGRILWPAAQRSPALVYPRDEQEIVSKVASIMRLQCKNRIRNKQRPTKKSERSVWDVESLSGDCSDESDFGDEGDIHHGSLGDAALVEQEQREITRSRVESTASKGKAPIRPPNIEPSQQHRDDSQDVTAGVALIDSINPRPENATHSSTPQSQSQAPHEDPKRDFIGIKSITTDARPSMLKRPATDEPGPSKRARFGSDVPNRQLAESELAGNEHKEKEQRKGVRAFELDGLPFSLAPAQTERLLDYILLQFSQEKVIRQWDVVRSGLADIQGSTVETRLKDIVDQINWVRMMIGHKPVPIPTSIRPLVIVVDSPESDFVDTKSGVLM